MPSILLHLGAFLAVSYAILDRPHVVQMAKVFGYGLGRSVGMLRNYRQNAEKLMKANPDGQKGVMGTMKDLDMVARELRMAMWMARPGAMLRMGPMGGMGMTISPPPQQQQQPQPGGYATPGTGISPGVGYPMSQSPAGMVQMPPGMNDGLQQTALLEDQHFPVFEGGSDLLVSSWRNGVERTRVLKRI